MAKFNSPVPYRHKSTQHPGGTLHQRPNQYSKLSKSVTKREMIHGTFEAELFDYDQLCLIPASELKNVNQQALNRVKQMGWNYQR